MTSVFSSQNSVRFCPASFCTPRPNLPVIPGISWLSTFVFQSPVMKGHVFFCLFVCLVGWLVGFWYCYRRSFPGGSSGKEFTCNVGDLGSIPGVGRSSGGEHGNPLQYSCLEKPHGQRSLAGYVPWGRKELDMTERLCKHISGLVSLHRTFQLVRHHWMGHRFGLLWFWMVCLGNEPRSFCCSWDCTQVLHFGLFRWLWGLLYFFSGILAHVVDIMGIWIKFTHSHPF